MQDDQQEALPGEEAPEGSEPLTDDPAEMEAESETASETVDEQPAVDPDPARSYLEETDGGPLGCCLGVMIGILLSLIVAVVARIEGESLVHFMNGALLANLRLVLGCTVVVTAIVGGILGWMIGRRIYKEYELSPRAQRKLAALERRQQTKLQGRRKRV